MLDYETVRAARLASQSRDPIVLNAEETAAVEAARADVRDRQARETHAAELAAAGKFFDAKAAAASKAGNPDDASLWDAAAETIAAGQWPIHRRIASDPEITRWQGVRTRLAYAGQTRRLDA